MSNETEPEAFESPRRTEAKVPVAAENDVPQRAQLENPDATNSVDANLEASAGQPGSEESAGEGKQAPLPEAGAANGPIVHDASELTPEQLADIESNAIPAIKRRAPKYKAFFWVGAIVGIVLGLILGIQSSSPGMQNRAVFLTVTVAFTTMIVCLISGFIALQLDNRSAARAEAQKKAIG